MLLASGRWNAPTQGTELGISQGFPGGSVIKNPPAHARDEGDGGLIPGLGRYPGKENGNPLKESCLENFMDRGAWWAMVHGGHKESDKTEHRHWAGHF